MKGFPTVLAQALAWVGITLMLTACGTTTQFPQIDPETAEAEARHQMVTALKGDFERHRRLDSVVWRITTSNADLCDRLTHRTGFIQRVLQDVPRDFRDVAKAEFGLSNTPTVTHVHPESPAEKAGLRKGDQVIAWNGVRVGKGTRAHSKIGRALKSFEGGSSSITVRRKGREAVLYVSPIPACDYPVQVARNADASAFANGSGVILTTGMLDFARSDSELALVISHEMAHNTMGHIESKMGNRLIGALIGALAGAAIGPGAGQQMTQFGADVGEMAFSQDFESEADYVGLYYAGRAGFDVSDAAILWRRMGEVHPEAIDLLGTSHPSTAKRFLAIGEAAKEFQRKKTLSLPLLPEKVGGS